MPTIAEQIGRLNVNYEMSAKARSFVNLARCIALGRDNHSIVRQLVHDNRVLMGPMIQNIVGSYHQVYQMRPDLIDRQKAAVAAGTTADTSFALPLADYQQLANAFLESLRNWGAFDRMLPSMRRVPLRTRIGASSVGITGNTVPQQQIKPIGRLTLTGGVIDEQKAVAILVITDELARFGDRVAGDLFAIELSNAVAVQTDTSFVSILIAGATSNPSAGATAEGTRADLRGMLAAINTNARSQLFLLMTSTTAKTLAVLHTSTGDAAFPGMNFNGGSIGGVQAVVSDGVPAGTMLLVDAQQIAAASDTVALSSSNEAILAMDSAPDSPASASTIMTSLWQNNFTGLKAERFFGATKLTSSGVAVVTGIAYVGDSPGP